MQGREKSVRCLHIPELTVETVVRRKTKLGMEGMRRGKCLYFQVQDAGRHMDNKGKSRWCICFESERKNTGNLECYGLGKKRLFNEKFKVADEV